jgi:hypothetical protein
MLLLCYVARHLYHVDLEKNEETDVADRIKTSNQTDQNSNDSNKQFPTTMIIA